MKISFWNYYFAHKDITNHSHVINHQQQKEYHGKSSKNCKIDRPKYFRLREILIMNAIGAIPAFLLGVSGTASLLCFPMAYITENHMYLGLALLFFTIAAMKLFFLPAILGNPYVRNIVKKHTTPFESVESSFIFQVTFTPRLHGGFRGLMEDADDIGYLDISEESLNFIGDHVQFRLPFSKIDKVAFNSSGWRGLWVTGKRIKILTSALHEYDGVELLERQSNTLRTSKTISEKIFQKIQL